MKKVAEALLAKTQAIMSIVMAIVEIEPERRSDLNGAMIYSSLNPTVYKALDRWIDVKIAHHYKLLTDIWPAFKSFFGGNLANV